VQWTKQLADKFDAESDFEIVTQPILALFTFRYAPQSGTDLDKLNIDLVNKINDDGRVYLTQTNHDGIIAIRFTCGQFETTEADVMSTLETVTELARSMTTS